MSKRLISLIVSGLLIPLAVEKLGVDLDTAWLIVTMVLGWIGVETVRPSGTVGLMGAGGAAPGK